MPTYIFYLYFILLYEYFDASLKDTWNIICEFQKVIKIQITKSIIDLKSVLRIKLKLH